MSCKPNTAAVVVRVVPLVGAAGSTGGCSCDVGGGWWHCIIGHRVTALIVAAVAVACVVCVLVVVVAPGAAAGSGLLAPGPALWWRCGGKVSSAALLEEGCMGINRRGLISMVSSPSASPPAAAALPLQRGGWPHTTACAAPPPSPAAGTPPPNTTAPPDLPLPGPGATTLSAATTHVSMEGEGARRNTSCPMSSPHPTPPLLTPPP